MNRRTYNMMSYNSYNGQELDYLSTDDMDDQDMIDMDIYHRPNQQRRFPSNRDEMYGNAYGDYRGGYGPRGGYEPSSLYMGPPQMGPPPMQPPMRPPIILGHGFGPRGPPIKKPGMDDKVIKYLIRCGVPKENLRNLPQDLLDLVEPEYCGLCGHSFDTFAVSKLHYTSKNHLKNQKKWISQSHSGDTYQGGPRENVPLKARELYCELCDVHITSKVHAESHYAGRPHRAIVEGRKMPKNPFLLQNKNKNRLEQLIRREKRSLKQLEEDEAAQSLDDVKPVQPELYCDICKTSVTCTEQMTMHLNGKRHLSKEKHFIMKSMKGESIPAPSGTLGIVKESADAEEENKQPEGGEDCNVEQSNENDTMDWGADGGSWEETEAVQA